MLDLNRILAVDDEPFNLELLKSILSDGYQFHAAQSGTECLRVASKIRPDVILLDVSMPNMNGYEVCRRLKQSEDTKDIPVMFVSARSTLDERIEGYNAGGYDYIVKPFAREELVTKLKALFKVKAQQRELETQVQQATEIAFSAMSNSSEVGIVMQFVERTKELLTQDSLCSALIEALSSYGLAASIELRTDDGQTQHYCSHGSVSPIVLELFDLLKNKGRIYSFEPRMIINYQQISILLMNMPQGDEDKMGRLRDHLCFIGSSAEQCLSSILTGQKLAQQKAALQETITLVKGKFEELVWQLNETHTLNEGVFKALQVKFEQHIPSMGLEEDQELYIFRSLDQTIEKSLSRHDQVADVQSTFKDIELDLNNLLVSD
jgi:DNA-binding response OmpR family regulator